MKQGRTKSKSACCQGANKIQHGNDSSKAPKFSLISMISSSRYLIPEEEGLRRAEVHRWWRGLNNKSGINLVSIRFMRIEKEGVEFEC